MKNNHSKMSGKTFICKVSGTDRNGRTEMVCHPYEDVVTSKMLTKTENYRQPIGKSTENTNCPRRICKIFEINGCQT